MQNRRAPAVAITPAREDTGLFKKGIVRLQVDLVPHKARSSRGDLVVKGFFQQNTQLDVIFAGRRAMETAPLEFCLERIFSNAIRVATRNQVQTNIDNIRFPVQVDGTWRPHFLRDMSGWETRSYQFLVAQWSFTDETGKEVAFGELPVDR
ncbi:hypothetical protein [Parasedimentitalea psychrophila]|uniref:Uncharacterized protein n=1 Tax=Parasedimentitalea psychrophila TaxID=2997337 RepID=A0A9Y2L397_9RHOB|nr:hypothetical protein [Parasedimentitalea psychrophila]WIY27175.1 hypothetical protein QPJ95_09800 [Parasedimentitalea psychrophila]